MKVPQWKKKALAKKMSTLPRRNRMAARSRIGRGIRQPVQFFKRSTWRTGFVTCPLGVVTNFKCEPTLADVPNYTEFTSLYDQYQIKGIKITLYPKFSEVAGVGEQTVGGISGYGSLNLMGQIASVIDYDGISTTPSMNDLVQYQNLRITRGHQTHHRYFKPAVASSVFKNTSALTSAYGMVKNKWLDCSNADVTHYGLYGIVDLSNLSPSFLGVNVDYDVKVDYYLAFKNVR